MKKKNKHTHTHSRRKRSQLWVQLCVPTCNTHRFRWEEGDDSLHTAARHPAWRRNILETKCYYISLCLFLCLKKRCHLLKYVQDLKVAEWPTTAASQSQWSWSRGDLETDVRCSPQPGLTGTETQPLRLTDASLKAVDKVLGCTVVVSFFSLYYTNQKIATVL